ncbi:aldo/keto reductase [Desulfovibrio sp. JC010]|uniref:aldo/keto reductase n=1 Tax=Desulfovibrio sp. JC010 TaxID=2593641 RepID=UPI0013D41F7F|nr:aldo/keto reductase [Desulfovibrio sp. JC010]NDV26716.1 aldo/keto reductase [Desulfovibrio sp. JC010]
MSAKIALKELGNSEIKISSIGLGCMGLSEFYGEPTSEKQGCELIHHALDQGVNFFDTADMYGDGHNENLLAKALHGRRDEAVIATKFGIVRENGEYARTISGKPEYIRKACHESLRRLGTDYIDLYYIHRVDTDTPIEETVGEMSKLVEEGKIRAIGISEASAETLRKAHAVHPLSALQSEYSMLTRDPEQEILGLTRELGISFVPYSPICRGLLSNWKPSEDKTDFRNLLPRFQGKAYDSNKAIAEALSPIAKSKGCTLAQLSLAWVCAQGENIIPIPGTTKIKNLDSNIGAVQVELSSDDLTAIEGILATHKVQGNRYTDEGMKGVNL